MKKPLELDEKIINEIPMQGISLFLEKYTEKNPQSLLSESSRYRITLVHGAEATEDLLIEIGRLREITFRSVGLGTGKSYDLDIYDRTYSHLIAWNKSKQWISGSYRFGLSPVILPQSGPSGFCTASYFHIQPQFFEILGDCIDLGRSFIRIEEQNQRPLYYLWKGIVQFLCQNKNYAHLFGTTSISQDYKPHSHHLMSKYLSKNHGCTSNIDQFITPKNPYGFQSQLSEEDIHRTLDNLDSLESLCQKIYDFEDGAKTVPPLIYRYAELGGECLNFQVDPHFKNSLDALFILNLKKIPMYQLKKFLPENQLEGFLERS